jgi:hypothetical protein
MKEQIQLPTVGRIVHFYPGKEDVEFNRNGAEYFPAIVTQVWGGLIANLNVFTPTNGVIPYLSVFHLSEAGTADPQRFWMYPSYVKVSEEVIPVREKGLS